jgi:ribose transport system substrate-binding protein
MSEIGGLTDSSGSFDRRRFLQRLGRGAIGVAMAGAVPTALAACGGGAQPAAEIGADAMADVWLGTSIRSLSNPYHALWKQGGEDFAASVDAADRIQTLVSEGDSAKQLRDMRALIARAGKGNVIFNIDPNEASDALPIARLCESSRCYFVTSWNKADNLHPWDFKYWVSHMSADDAAMGKQVAEALVTWMHGRGKIGAILGLRGNTASQGRLRGLKQVLADHPSVELVRQDNADWQRAKAQSLAESMLAAHPDLNGIWAADDGMALGALEAVKANGRARKTGVVGIAGVEEAVRAVLAGDMVGTAGIDAVEQGGRGLAIAWHAQAGDLDVALLPREHREFYFGTTLLTKRNAQKFLDTMIAAQGDRDWNDIWVSEEPAQEGRGEQEVLLAVGKVVGAAFGIVESRGDVSEVVA